MVIGVSACLFDRHMCPITEESMHSARMFAAMMLAAIVSAAPIGAQPTPPAPAGITAESVAKAKFDGEMMAMNAPGWFGRGTVIGFLAGPIGIAVGYAIAASSDAELPADKKVIVAKEPIELQAVYEKSYADQVRKKRKSTINRGGWTGFVALVGLFILSGSSGG
jgi:hypothetical protein